MRQIAEIEKHESGIEQATILISSQEVAIENLKNNLCRENDELNKSLSELEHIQKEADRKAILLQNAEDEIEKLKSVIKLQRETIETHIQELEQKRSEIESSLQTISDSNDQIDILKMKIHSLERQQQILELQKAESTGILELENGRLKEDVALVQQKLDKV